MPRKPRVVFEGALYHVTSRGNARQDIFHQDEDRERFLAQLGERVASYGVVLHAFVLMDNHYHLLVRTPAGNLPRFMQRLNTSYALYYRYKHKRPGHVFQGRYKALLVTDDRYLLTLSRYIHLNPIKTKRWRKSPARESLAELNRYPWSSYPSYVAGKAVWPWLNLKVLEYYGGPRHRAGARYRAYTEAMITRDDEELVAALQAATGWVGAEPATLERDEESTSAKFDWDAMDEAVASYFKIDRKVLRQHGHVAGAAKRVAMALAVRRSGASLRVIGQHYGDLSANAVSMNRKRLRPADQKQIDRIGKIV